MSAEVSFALPFPFLSTCTKQPGQQEWCWSCKLLLLVPSLILPHGSPAPAITARLCPTPLPHCKKLVSLFQATSFTLSLFIPVPGHVFNMPHDNVKACEEVFGRLKTNHMMSPTLIQIDRANPWSACSAAIITDFLDSGHGEPSYLYPVPREQDPCPGMVDGLWSSSSSHSAEIEGMGSPSLEDDMHAFEALSAMG